MRLRSLILIVLAIGALLGLAACDIMSKPTATPLPTATLAPPTETPVPPTATPIPPTATPTLTPTPKPAVYEKVACPFRLPTGISEGKDVECGYLVVPEDRSDPQSRSIRLAVAVFRNPDRPAEPDPIVYLSGGPGGSALEFLYLSYSTQVTPLFDSGRDVIFYDQRGVGLSKPALDCPAAIELEFQLMNPVKDGKVLTDQEQDDMVAQAMLACEKDLSSVAKLSAYNSVASAADVNDLRIALGYKQLNLWGVSYGTRLALEVMRDFPAAVRSVVLDSVYPPDVDLYAEQPASIMRVLDTLFDGCSKDKVCNTAYPDLRKTFFDTAAALSKEPQTITATNPLNNKVYPVRVDGATFLGVIFQMFYETDMIPSLPQIINQAKNKDLSQAAQFLGVIVAQGTAMSPGMQYSVQCNEERPFTSEQDYQAALAKYPELAPYMTDDNKLGATICAGWESGKAAAIENQPVTSSLPALVMAGEYDPITPPAWAKHAAQTLSKSYFFEYPGLGHGVSVGEECPTSMMLEFLDDPSQAPDDWCIADMVEPQFYAASSIADIKLEPYTDATMGFTSVRPVGWREIATGTYARSQSSLDVAILFQISGEAATAERIGLVMLNQLGITSLPTTSTTYKSATLTWRVYQTKATLAGQQLTIAFGLADSGGRAYVVMLTSSADELDALTKAVLTPAMDAMTVKK